MADSNCTLVNIGLPACSTARRLSMYTPILAARLAQFSSGKQRVAPMVCLQSRGASFASLTAALCQERLQAHVCPDLHKLAKGITEVGPIQTPAPTSSAFSDLIKLRSTCKLML